MKIGLIREQKKPFDKRVCLSPQQCKELIERYKLKIFVQPSPHRCFDDIDYNKYGCCIKEDLQECDLLLGIKEVPVSCLIPNKKYMFFSHTIKKQEYNRDLLKNLISKNITMIDYEVIKDKGKRIIGFGRFAGIVGAYNAFFGYGLKSKNFKIKRAFELETFDAICSELSKVDLNNEKILVTGKGRVARGAMDILDFLKIKKVNKYDYLNNHFNYPVYCNIDISDYYERKNNGVFNKQEFYKKPFLYNCKLNDFIKNPSIFIAGHFHNSEAGILLNNTDFINSKLQVVSDISCDIGFIACTLRESTISDPIYGYDPLQNTEVDYSIDDSLLVVAVSNLPCELPIDSSIDFGRIFVDKIFPLFLKNDDSITDATICKNNRLTDKYIYLEDFLLG